MEVFQSWADIIIMFALGVAYIFTFIAQRKTIVTLKERIDAFEKTNSAAVALSDAQSVHIEAYKRIANIEDIEKYSTVRAVAILTEMLSNREDLVEDLKRHSKEIINQNLLDNNVEQMIFLKYLFDKVLKYDIQERTKIVNSYLPNSSNIILPFFQRLEAVVEIQKTPN